MADIEEKMPAGIECYGDLSRLLDLLPEAAQDGVAGGNWERWVRNNWA